MSEANFDSRLVNMTEQDTRHSYVWASCTSRNLYEVIPAVIHAKNGVASQIHERHKNNIEWETLDTVHVAQSIVRHLRSRWRSPIYSGFTQDLDPAQLLCELLAYAAGHPLGPERGQLPQRKVFRDKDEALKYLTTTFQNWITKDYHRWKRQLDRPGDSGDDIDAADHPSDDDTTSQIQGDGSTDRLDAAAADGHSIENSHGSPQLEEPNPVPAVDAALKAYALADYPQQFLYWFVVFGCQYNELQGERSRKGTSTARRREISEIVAEHLGDRESRTRFPGSQQYVRGMISRLYSDPDRDVQPVTSETDAYLCNLRQIEDRPRGTVPAKFFDDDNEFQSRIPRALERAYEALATKFRDELGIDRKEKQ